MGIGRELLRGRNKAIFKEAKCNEANYKTVHVFDGKRVGGFKLEVQIQLFIEIIKKVSLSVGWYLCRVQETFDFARCFNCNEFGHKILECKSSVRCIKCSGEHRRADFSSQESRYSNCVRANKNLNMELDINHEVTSMECSVMRRKMEMRRIDYGENKTK